MLLTVLRRWSRCCSYSVWLCGLYYGALHVLKSSRDLCPRVSSFLLALCSPRLEKRELVCVFLVHLIVCFVDVKFGHFSLPPFVGSWLRFVVVTLPGFLLTVCTFNKNVCNVKQIGSLHCDDRTVCIENSCRFFQNISTYRGCAYAL